MRSPMLSSQASISAKILRVGARPRGADHVIVHDSAARQHVFRERHAEIRLDHQQRQGAAVKVAGVLEIPDRKARSRATWMSVISTAGIAPQAPRPYSSRM